MKAGVTTLIGFCLLAVLCLILTGCPGGGGGGTPSTNASGIYISGYITTTAGTGLSNVTITISFPGSSNVVATTSSSGYYYFGALTQTNYTVTPSLAGYGFSPATINVMPTASGVNFTGVNISTPLFGMNFGPYLPGQNPSAGTFITTNQIRQRLSAIAPFTKWVRTYSMGNGFDKIAPIAHELGLKTAVGAWLSTDSATNTTELNSLIAAAKAGYVDMAIVGSEALLRKDLTESALIGYINAFRSQVPSVPVTTAEPNTIFLDYINIEAACDVLFVNYYPYWNGVVESNAIVDLNASHQQMVDLYGSKPIYVSETGWPSAGGTVGNAVPSGQNAPNYLIDFVTWAESGVHCAGYFYFESFDEAWKSAAEGEQGAHWGIWDQYGNLKANMYEVFEGWRSSTNNAGPLLFQITYVPPQGSANTTIVGQALGIIPANYQVAVYIEVNGGWWTKPFWNLPLSAINYNGSWECDVETGGNDTNFTAVAAYLVPANYSPPLVSGGALPSASLMAVALAEVQATRP